MKFALLKVCVGDLCGIASNSEPTRLPRFNAIGSLEFEMSEKNIEIESHLTKLASICSQSLRGGDEPNEGVVNQLLKSLLMSGYGRQEGPPLQHELEQRVKSGSDDKALHHAEEVLGITRSIQKRFDELKRWESTHPRDQNQSKTANISAATDS